VGANPAVTMAYDANGNLTSDGTWTHAYDAQNMLRSSTKSGASASYDYDVLGRRQRLTENALVTTFLHDGDEEIADYDGSANLLRRYVPGPGTDMPIAMVTPSGGSNTRKYFHTNRQGSTVAMSADNGTIAEGPYTYDAYGDGAPTTGVPFKYTGRRLDALTGCYYYRARYYSPKDGRFLQVDPVGYQDDTNLYVYVSNNALNKADPSGLTGHSCGKMGTGCDLTSPEESTGEIVGEAADYYGDALTGLAMAVHPGAGGGVREFVVTIRALRAAMGAAKVERAIAAARAGVLASGQRIVGASSNPSQNLTAFGHAFTKHAMGQRTSGTFEALQGSNAQLNQRGYELAKEILGNVDSVTHRGGVTIVRDASGRGIQYNSATKEFIGFLDPLPQPSAIPIPR